MTASTSWKLGLGLIIAFWALVSLFDFPAPFIDDMYYIGAAINLAQHGILSNPYCESLATIGCADHYYAQMPLHVFFLAAWFHLFGLSTLSFHVLYTLLALGVSLLVFRFVPRAPLAWLAAVFIAMAVYGLLGGLGLRPDALGLFFLMLGFDTWRARTPLGFFARNFLLGLVVITFPNVALPAIVLSLFGLVHQNVIGGKTIRELAPFALTMAAAYALCFAIFMACIGGHLFAFLTALTKAQRLGVAGVRDRFHFLTAQGLAKWVVPQAAFLVVLGLLLTRAWRDPHRREERLFLGLAALLCGCLWFSSISSASGAHVWAFACLVTLLILLLREKSVVGAWPGYAVVFAVTAFGHDHVAIQNLLAERPPDAAQRQALRDRIAQMQPVRLYLNPYAMRELYDYQMPPNSFDYETSSTTGWGPPKSASELPKNALVVVSVGAAFPTARTPNAGAEARPLRILGVQMSGVSANPYQLEIVDTRK